jgi:hypothetical protein
MCPVKCQSLGGEAALIVIHVGRVTGFVLLVYLRQIFKYRGFSEVSALNAQAGDMGLLLRGAENPITVGLRAKHNYQATLVI